MEERLNFPDGKDFPPSPVLSMEEYVQFVSTMLEEMIGREKLEKMCAEEKKEMRYTPFRIVS